MIPSKVIINGIWVRFGLNGRGVIDYFYTDDGHHFVKHTRGHFNERGAGLVNIIFGHFDPHSLTIFRHVLILTLSILIAL